MQWATDNVIRKFIDEAADAGIDVFRIFNSLNWFKGMQVVDKGSKKGEVIETCVHRRYFDENRTKYNLKYYVTWLKSWKNVAHI